MEIVVRGCKYLVEIEKLFRISSIVCFRFNFWKNLGESSLCSEGREKEN